jgi:mannitol-1-/sugar-/sorbitol-6-phosphatase
MDGTLLTSVGAVERCWSAWAERVGAPSAAVIDYMHGRTARDTVRKFATANLDVQAEVKWLDDLEIKDLDGIEAIPGVKHVLNVLGAEQWAVVTSANQALARLRIGAAGLPLPHHLVSSDDVTEGKPQPEGYLRGAALLGANPQRCLVFEDTYAGVQAGQAAGMNVILVDGTHSKSDFPVLATIKSFDELSICPSDSLIYVSAR